MANPIRTGLPATPVGISKEDPNYVEWVRVYNALAILSQNVAGLIDSVNSIVTSVNSVVAWANNAGRPTTPGASYPNTPVKVQASPQG